MAKNVFKERKINDGYYVIRLGEVRTKIAFETKDLFRMFCIMNGEENTSMFFFENQLVADYSFNFLTQFPSFCPIQALEDSIVYSVLYNVLQKLYEFKN